MMLFWIHSAQSRSLYVHITTFPEANSGRAFKMYILLIYKEDVINLFKDITVESFRVSGKKIIHEHPGYISSEEMILIPGKSYDPKEIKLDPNRLLLSIVVFAVLEEYKNQATKSLLIPKLIIPGNTNPLKIYVKKNGLSLVT